MVELDKLKKVNALASELKKHNFAETNDEAAKLAEEFYQNKKEEKEDEKKSVKLENDALSEERFELMMEMREKKMQQELEHMRSTIGFLKNRMDVLNNEVEKLKGKALSSPITFEKKKDEIEVQANLKKEKEQKKDHPKSGDYSSNDVDIQKMFYFGNKNSQE